jgi:FixJ family two-component response regulator
MRRVASSTAAQLPTAFILDDDETVRQGLVRLTRAAGIRSEAFETGDALSARIGPDTAGCLVLDVRMPGLNGLDLYDRLAEHGKGLPVVFLSAYLDIGLTVRAMRAGAIEVLQKPCHSPDLLEAIKRAFAIDERRRQDQLELRLLRSRYEMLTPRERDVMGLVVRGLANKVIAGDLGASEKTVKTHRGHLMRKLRARGMADLVRFADRLSLPSSSD